jgi:TatD DNase family protein
MLIDTHAHLYADAFDSDRSEMILRAQSEGVNKIFLPNIDIQSIKGMMQLVAEFPDVCYPMMGLHPCDVKEDFEKLLAEIEQKLFENPKQFVAIGETGIDLYWDKSTLEWQVASLEKHIEWAKQTKLPLVIHARESLDELIAIFQNPAHLGVSGVFHCFTGNLDQAKAVLDFGFYLGIGGVATFKNSGLCNVLPQIPIDRIVLETDAPYLAPVPHRGKRNESAYVKLVAHKVAEFYGKSFEEIAVQTTENAHKLFRL